MNLNSNFDFSVDLNLKYYCCNLVLAHRWLKNSDFSNAEILMINYFSNDTYWLSE